MTENRSYPLPGVPLTIGSMLFAIMGYAWRAPNTYDLSPPELVPLTWLLSLLLLANGIKGMSESGAFRSATGQIGLTLCFFAALLLAIGLPVIAIMLVQVQLGVLLYLVGVVLMPIGLIVVATAALREGRVRLLGGLFLLVGLLAGPVAIVLEFYGPNENRGWQLWQWAISFGWILIGLVVAAEQGGGPPPRNAALS